MVPVMLVPVAEVVVGEELRSLLRVGGSRLVVAVVWTSVVVVSLREETGSLVGVWGSRLVVPVVCAR